MVVVIFRSRVLPDADMAALERAGMRMVELASQMPVSCRTRTTPRETRESLTPVQFQDEPTLLAWRNHPEHVQVQDAARRDYFSQYHIQVCKPTREYTFGREHGRRDIAAS